jgi:copper chaperone CopZ
MCDILENRDAMQKASFPIDEFNICVECAIALKRFIGGLEGVESIEGEFGKIVVYFDEKKIDPELLARITKDSLRKLGY